MLSLGFASAAHAVDYPPTTTSQHVEGTTVASTTTVDGPTTAKTEAPVTDGGLPFTGGNDSALVWVGVAAVGTGTFAAFRFRRRTRTS